MDKIITTILLACVSTYIFAQMRTRNPNTVKRTGTSTQMQRNHEHPHPPRHHRKIRMH